MVEAFAFGLAFFVVGSGVCIVVGSLMYVVFNKLE